MDHALRHGEALLRPELDRAPFEIDEELAVHYVEKLVLVVVLVPVKLAVEVNIALGRTNANGVT